MKISFLYLIKPSENRISRQIFEDLNLTILLNDNAVRVLSVPCCADDILARQEIFSNMKKELFYSKLNTFYNSVVTLAQVKSGYENAKTVCEKYFMLAKFADAYINLTNAADISSDCSFTIKLMEYVFTQQQQIICLKNNIQEYKQILNRITYFNFSTSYSGNFISKSKKTDTITDIIDDCLTKLGYSKSCNRTKIDLRATDNISESVISLFADDFKRLAELEKLLLSCIDTGFIELKNELDFYFHINEIAKKAESNGTFSCFPIISETPAYKADSVSDISLIAKGCTSIVPNEADFDKDNSVYFLTGANGGGKTTYLRALAINLILFLGGCPVFSNKALIYPFKKIYTHFPADERFTDSGRYVEEINRINEILSDTDNESFVFLNETFTGTDENNGSKQTLDVARALKKVSAFCLYVTHFHDVVDYEIPSLNTLVSQNEQNQRTYKIVKNMRYKSSFAQDILIKYGLDRDSLNKKEEGNA